MIAKQPPVALRRQQLHSLGRLLARPYTRRRGEPRLRFVQRELGVPAYYRVLHQAEQARLAGIPADIVAADNLAQLYSLAECDALYLHRLPLTSYTLPLLVGARLRRIPVIFDSDDLVWDAGEREYNFLDRHYPPATITAIMRENRRLGAMMRWANALVLATPYLAARAQQSFRKPVFVHVNAVDQTMCERAAQLVATAPQRAASASVIIGYFAGTPHVHEEDLASVAPALCAVLERYPHAQLRLYGQLRLTPDLARLAEAGRIEQRTLIPWHNLLEHIALVDLSIAPLIDNPQRRAKSAVKYIEAALVGVPTVAQRLDPYQDAITHGCTGMLAATPADWQTTLGQLVESAALRQKIGIAARTHVLGAYTTSALAPRFAALIRQVLP